MLELGDRLSLSMESGPGFFVVCQVRVEQLERDLSVEKGVDGPVDDRHAAATDLVAQFVPPETSYIGRWLQVFLLAASSDGSIAPQTAAVVVLQPEMRL